jgi:hypothetical protein
MLLIIICRRSPGPKGRSELEDASALKEGVRGNEKAY